MGISYMLLSSSITCLFLKIYKIKLKFKDHKLHDNFSKVHMKMGKKSHSPVRNEDSINCLGAV